MENNQLLNEIFNKLNSFQEETKKQNEQINQKIDRIDEKLTRTKEELKEEINGVKIDIEGVKGDIKVLGEKVGGIEKRIDNEEFFSRLAFSALLVGVLSGVIKYFWFPMFNRSIDRFSLKLLDLFFPNFDHIFSSIFITRILDNIFSSFNPHFLPQSRIFY